VKEGGAGAVKLVGPETLIVSPLLRGAAFRASAREPPATATTTTTEDIPSTRTTRDLATAR
jgi:hypothetical protein